LSASSRSFPPATASTIHTPLLYTGRRLDPETILYYYRARYYHAGLGRFVSRDPIGYVDGVNFYQYVGNSPTQFVDPSGLDAEQEALGQFLLGRYAARANPVRVVPNHMWNLRNYYNPLVWVIGMDSWHPRAKKNNLFDG